MLVADQEKSRKDVRLPLEGERLKLWEEMLDARGKIPQQTALYAMIDWIVRQEELLQSMILGQIPARKDLAAVVTERLIERDRIGRAPHRSTDRTRSSKPRTGS